MRTRRHVARFAASVAAVSSVAVGFAAQPASASPCEVVTTRQVTVDDVELIEGNPQQIDGFTYNYSEMTIYVKTWGCLTESALTWKVAPELGGGPSGDWDPADADDVKNAKFATTGITGTMKWAAGEQATKAIRIFIRRDLVQEPSKEVLYLDMFKKYGGITKPPRAHGFILNDDVPVPK